MKKAPPSSPCSLFSLLVRRRFLSEILRLQIESLSEKRRTEKTAEVKVWDGLDRLSKT